MRDTARTPASLCRGFIPLEDDGSGGGFGAETPPAATDAVENAPFEVDLSISLVMDYSGSIVNVQEFRTNMEVAAKTLVNSMADGGEAEMSKYRSERQITQEFTKDETFHKYAHCTQRATSQNGGGTALLTAAAHPGTFGPAEEEMTLWNMA